MTVNSVTICKDDNVAEQPDPEELSLEELADRCGVTARTVRYYQSQRVLPRPRKHGHYARYNTEHVQRLEHIAELQERGLKLEAIRAVLAHEDSGAAGDWLGLDAALRNPWISDRSRTMSLSELHQLLGERPRRVVGELADTNMVSRQADGSFLVPSPALLDIALRLSDAGVSIDVADRAATLLRRRLAKAAQDLVALFEGETGRSFAGSGTPQEIATALDTVRPIALDAAGLILAQEMEQVLRHLAAGGPRRPARRRLT
jgi:DNA-binding transcriptional MerR regulator